jgi:hypothetical protein
MWFHDHDIHSDLTLSHSNILYLVRDPKDVIFSLLKAEHKSTTEALVDEQIGLLRAHHQKYLQDSHCVVYYGDLQSDLHKEFRRITDWFGKAFDSRKIDVAQNKVTKDKVINKSVDKRYFNSAMLSSVYEKERGQFKERFGSKIDDELLVGDFWREHV